MQKNDFEKQVSQNLEDFSLLPADSVWQKVEARVAKDKERRKLLFFWMFAAILLIGGGAGAWFFINNNTDSALTSTKVELETSQPKDTRQNPTTENQTSSLTNQADENAAKTKTDLTAGMSNKKPEIQLNQSSTAITKKLKKDTKSKSLQIHSSYNTPTSTEEKDIKKHETNEETTLTEKAATTLNNEQVDDKKVDVKPQANIESSATPVSADNSIAEIKKPSVQKKKPAMFGLTILGGISDNVRSIRLLPDSRASDMIANASPSQTQSQAQFNNIPVYKYTSSTSWGAGLFVQNTITNKIGIMVGLNYQFMSANISTGIKIDSLRTFQDSALMKSATVTTFYRPGETENYKNRYHLLQIPIDMMFQLNTNTQRPLTFSAGFTGGVLLGSNALYLNEKARTYYKEKDQLKRFMLGVQSGLALTVVNNPKYQIQAGPHIQYQISNLTKPVINSNEHLLFLGVKGNILFKKRK